MSPRRGDHPAPFAVKVRPEGDTTIVVVSGEVDLASASRLGAAIESAAAHGRVTLDLDAVSFMDSTGLRELMASRRRHGDCVVLGRRSAQVDRLLEISGLRDMFGP